MQSNALYVLHEVKNLLNLVNDDTQDDLLKTIINNVNGRLLTYTGYDVLPNAILWILIELTCSRYNLLGSEGVHSELNEGIQYIYDKNLLEEYRDELDRFVSMYPPRQYRKFVMI